MANLRLPKAGTIEVVPSILSSDFAKLADEIAEIESAGVNMVHLDIMDGHFVPNMTIGSARRLLPSSANTTTTLFSTAI
jgi:pentose-5-phosphate-3-epimerase